MGWKFAVFPQGRLIVVHSVELRLTVVFLLLLTLEHLGHIAKTYDYYQSKDIFRNTITFF